METIKLGKKIYELKTINTRKFRRHKWKENLKDKISWTKIQLEFYGMKDYIKMRNAGRKPKELYDCKDIIELTK